MHPLQTEILSFVAPVKILVGREGVDNVFSNQFGFSGPSEASCLGPFHVFIELFF